MRLPALMLTLCSFLMIQSIVFAEEYIVPISAETHSLVEPDAKDQTKSTPHIVEPLPTESEKKDDVKKVKLHHGKVITIHNSVSFTVKDDAGKEHVLRLSEINTPYIDKFHGPESLKALKELIDNKDVLYEILGTDRMGKKIVKATIGDIKINTFMIGNGHAWMSKKFGHDPELIELQNKAKAEKIGLWANVRMGTGAKSMKKYIHKNNN